MKPRKTREPQYQVSIEYQEKYGLQTLGLMSSHTWITDPRHLVFLLYRYKFVAKMFKRLDKVLEVGCADAFGTRIVRQEVGSLTAIDFDPVFVEDAKKRIIEPYAFECFVHDILEGPVGGDFDGIYSLDVLEHIPRSQEKLFLYNIVRSLVPRGTVIIGTPSLQSQAYASPASREGHRNCKDGDELKELLLQFFHNVFIFSMNDEVVHTGFTKMAHYLLALCCCPRENPPGGVD